MFCRDLARVPPRLNSDHKNLNPPMEALLDGLNDAQRSAVTSPASVLQVLAPPGSGKTKTLTARVAYLVNHERLQPWNIVVCTFTNKAAREMKERIQQFVGDGVEKKLILGTFHSVARRFLSRYGQEIGIPKNFGITDDGRAIISRIVKRQQYNVDPGHARSRISGLKAKGISADQYAATSKKADEHDFACLYAEYEEHLRSQNLLDFDDLLLRCVELLRKHPVCVSSIQAVLIDEYQDTNNVQYELMKLMASKMNRITIVGDPDQSIYSFRSAEIKNLLRMRDDFPESIVINLENNYRSSACILSSAMAVIEQDESRPSKALVPTHCVGEPPTLRHLATAHIEAKWIIEEINRTKTLTAGLLNYNDYAILLRSNAISLSIERALGNAGIPYRVVGGKRFFDRAEIKIVLGYLRVINQPDNNDALVSVINTPSRKIGESTVKALQEEAEIGKITLWKLILDCAQGRKKPKSKISQPAQKGIETFVNLILTSRRKLLPDEGDECNLFDLINHVLQRISFEAHLKHTYKDNWRDRWANVEELVSQATQLAAAVANDEAADDALPVVEGIEQRPDTAADLLSKFLANVALSTDVERADGEQLDQVTISTIHAAKGLEWPVVFIPAVYDGHIPHSRAEDHDEERRLLYVGMTRAQALLYLSCPMKQSTQDDTSLSKFVSDCTIQKLFSNSGPSIGCSVIQDLAQILRRPCPAFADVEAAQNLLERIEDDQYPLTRDEIDGEEPSWSISGPFNERQEPSFKWRRAEVPISGSRTASVSVTSSARFSTRAAISINGNGGFTSARDIKAMQEEAEAIRMLASAQDSTTGKVAYSAVKRVDVKTTQTKRAKPRAAGQGAITSFFARSGSTLSEPDEQIAPKPISLKRSSSSLSQNEVLGDISNIQSNQTSPPRSFRPYQPVSLPKHKLHNAPMTGKPKKARLENEIGNKRHILLSSSPAKPDGPPQAGYLSDEDENDQGQSGRPSKQTSSSFASASGFRPASSFHTTTVSQVQNSYAPQIAHAPQRKQLGMGKIRQGWKNSQFAPPRPRQP